MEYPQNPIDGTGVPLSGHNPFKPGGIRPYLFKPFMPFSVPHTLYDFSAVKWYWMPGFRLDILLLLKVIGAVSVVLGTICAIFVPSLAGKAILSILFFAIISPSVAWLHTNIGWNQTLRNNICHSKAKSIQAKEIWKPETAHEYLLAKDTFNEETGWGYSIRVLRDGSVEIRAERSDTADDIASGMGDYASKKLGGIGDVKISV